MMKNFHVILTLLSVVTVFATCVGANSAGGCFSSLEALNRAEARRGANNTTPITRIICSNSLFLVDFVGMVLNGNTNYLCGADGSSRNNCTLRGGSIQMAIDIPSYDSSNKSNIVVSGFTFEGATTSSDTTSVFVVSEGKSLFRDCIFKNLNGYGVFLAAYFGKSPEVDIVNHRELTGQSKLRRLHEHRRLLIGGGSEPRVTIHIDRCQFLNNSLTQEILIPVFANNGPINIDSHFADVTISNSLFKDNYYEFNRQIAQPGFLVRVQTSSTVNISNSCMINNYVEGSISAPITVIADSGLVATRNNFATDIPFYEGTDIPAVPCQFLVLQEAYKCIAPESRVCRLPACAASYEYYNARTDQLVSNIVNGGTITASPCNFNIKINLPCAPTGKNVTMQLLSSSNAIVATREQVQAPFFLYGQSRSGNIFGGNVTSGTYKVQALVNGIIQPSSATFIISGRC